ncbi:penicillin-binding protein, beta-lactamase class C [Halovivax ruber XH-70]|uniref:Penicillin-binding protein, beta-lactamase class C n=1 Tax=Halovivax ruber (strain DSM 18193 / JCM 13892 / XH-70) TaxID=797302 RepID=L0IAF4_HALRX|nr:serine hydrolase [Halovivax ruber]AGB15719.1 penicillin-binding protein, beta-lactamase class C [Halovivax ruber XH-70]
MSHDRERSRAREHASLDPETVDTIDELLRNRLAEDDIPGLSLAISDRDGVLYATGYGSRDIESNDPATSETVYGIGSVSKSFASLATLQLVASDELALDDPVTHYLDVDIPDEITLHHLLSHTSGFPSLAVSEALLGRQLGIGEAGVPLGSREDVLAHVESATDEITDDPGEHWQYYNSGYTLVGEVIETVTGTAYTDHVSRKILGPLAMDRSTFDGDRFDSFEDRMTPYFAEDDELTPYPLPIREHSAAAGGLLAPVTDLVRYLRMHLRGGELDGTRLCDEETLQRAYEAHAETPAGPYGYGWRTRDVGGESLIGHGGSIAISTAYAGFSPDHDVAIALLANTSPGYGLAELGKGVFAALTGTDPETLPFFSRRARFEELSGEYESYRGIKRAAVEPAGGTLRLRIGGPIDGDGEWQPLVPTDVEAGRFDAVSAAGDRIPVRFVRKGGDLSCFIDRWRLHQC